MIYFDNAATTWPKPEAVYQAVDDCMRHYAANPGRAGHKMALRAAREIYETRELLAQFFHLEDAAQVIFTANATDSLNIAIKGVLEPGDHVLLTAMEHNAVARPIKALEKKGISNTVVPCDAQGRLRVMDVRRLLRPNTKLIVMTHVSNLTGTILPVAEVAALARERGVLFLLDASQSAGVYDIDVQSWGVDMLAAPGHKGLLGVQGTGILYLRTGLEVATLKEGGTGSKSHELEQPLLLPDRYESGTLNTPGIAGLKAGIQFIQAEGIANIRRHEQALTASLLEQLAAVPGLTLYGPGNSQEQGAVVAFNLANMDCSQTAFLLDSEFDICCRSGLHCAPLAHETIGTTQQGAVRLSPGYFNTFSEVDQVAAAVRQLAGR